MYGFHHKRTEAKFQDAWQELQAALPNGGGQGGLLLGVSGNKLLLDGIPLESGQSETSFARLLSAAGLASINFSRRVTAEDIAALVRAFANIADELEAAGYSEPDIGRIKHALDRYLKLREIIRNASGETLDLKTYEADMRHLIDTYIEASEPRKISPFDGMSLLDLIVKTGIGQAINSLPDGIRSSRAAVAETIENNVRSKIIKEHLNDPAYYEKMSALLDEIIAARNWPSYISSQWRRSISLKSRAGSGDSSQPLHALCPARSSVVGSPRTLRPVTYTVAPSSPRTTAIP